MSPFNDNGDVQGEERNIGRNDSKDEVMINHLSSTTNTTNETDTTVDITKQSYKFTSIFQMYIEKYLSSILITSILMYCIIINTSTPQEIMTTFMENNSTVLSLPLVFVGTFAGISFLQSLPEIINTINNLTLKQHVIICAVASSTAFFILLYSLFSLITIISFFASIALSCFGIYLAIGDIKKYGIASYVPSWILEYEYPQTIDEYMRDTTFMNEHRYLLLYFIPGIDLEGMLGQLSDRRRENLFRRWTVADILGINCHTEKQDEPMLLLTDSQETENIVDFEVPNDLEWEEDQGRMREISRGNSNKSKLMEEEEVPSEVLTYENTAASTRSNEEEKMIDPREEEWKYEESLINNALSSFYTNTATSIIKSISDALQPYSSLYDTNILYGNVAIMGMFGTLALFASKSGMRYGNGVKNVSCIGVFASGASLALRLGFKGLVSFVEGQCEKDKFSSLD